MRCVQAAISLKIDITTKRFDALKCFEESDYQFRRPSVGKKNYAAQGLVKVYAEVEPLNTVREHLKIYHNFCAYNRNCPCHGLDNHQRSHSLLDATSRQSARSKKGFTSSVTECNSMTQSEANLLLFEVEFTRATSFSPFQHTRSHMVEFSPSTISNFSFTRAICSIKCCFPSI